MKKAQFFLILLLATVAASNVLAEGPDAFTLAWTDFKFKNKDLLNVQSPDTLSQAKNDNAGLEGSIFSPKHRQPNRLIQQRSLRSPRPFPALTRPRGNPPILGGDFFILLNQIDNYAMQGDVTDKTRWINNWAFQPVMPVPMDKTIGENWIWVNRPTFNFVLNADLPDVDEIKSGLNPGGGPGGDRPSSISPGGVPFDSFSGFGDIITLPCSVNHCHNSAGVVAISVWAGGLTTGFPPASKDELGGGVYSVGLLGVLAFIGKKFIFGGGYRSNGFPMREGGNGSGD